MRLKIRGTKRAYVNGLEEGRAMLWETERYGYLCLMRPPVPGAVPRDGLVQCDDVGGYSKESGRHYWGRVVYDRELTEAEMEHYDLERTALAVLD